MVGSIVIAAPELVKAERTSTDIEDVSVEVRNAVVLDSARLHSKAKTTEIFVPESIAHSASD